MNDNVERRLMGYYLMTINADLSVSDLFRNELITMGLLK